jgi:hypothetical protein
MHAEIGELGATRRSLSISCGPANSRMRLRVDEMERNDPFTKELCSRRATTRHGFAKRHGGLTVDVG